MLRTHPKWTSLQVPGKCGLVGFRCDPGTKRMQPLLTVASVTASQHVTVDASCVNGGLQGAQEKAGRSASAQRNILSTLHHVDASFLRAAWVLAACGHGTRGQLITSRRCPGATRRSRPHCAAASRGSTQPPLLTSVWYTKWSGPSLWEIGLVRLGKRSRCGCLRSVAVTADRDLAGAQPPHAQLKIRALCSERVRLV